MPYTTGVQRMWIGGRQIGAQDAKCFTTVSPAHDSPVATYVRGQAADVDAAVAAARAAFDQGDWAMLPGRRRARLLHDVAQRIRADKASLARLEVMESGKPITQAYGEIAAAVDLWEYASTLCRHTRGDTYNTLGRDKLGMVLREPTGVVGMITPWNFPLLVISQKLPFALAAGCTAVIKPSELTPGTTLALSTILHEAGVPPGVVNVVTGFGTPVGQAIAEHADVDALSFTGSTRVGRIVAARAGANLKRVSLELGGKNPHIVFADADLDAALDAVVFGVYFNMGECCNSGSRLLVQRSIADTFTEQIVALARTIRIGDPLETSTKVGAIISQAHLDKIERYVASGLKDGANLLLGGQPISTASGRFFEATVLGDVAPDMAVARDEIFGPVLSVIPFDTVDEAVQLANDTLYGLSAGVWTRDVGTAFEVSRAVRAGTIWINCFMDGYPELPFGGYRDSGLGRELGRFSGDEFTELKTVQLHLGPTRSSWL